VERFFALGFALEQLHLNLKDLEQHVAEWANRPSKLGATVVSLIDPDFARPMHHLCGARLVLFGGLYQ
jgi:hypothetical protein